MRVGSRTRIVLLWLWLTACGGATGQSIAPQAVVHGVVCRIHIPGGHPAALVLGFGDSGTATLQALTLRGTLEPGGLTS